MKRLAVLLLVLLTFLAGCGDLGALVGPTGSTPAAPTPMTPPASPTFPASPTITPTPRIAASEPAWQKGFTLYDEPPYYGSPQLPASLRQLKLAGASVVVPVVTWYVPNPQSSSIITGTLTPSDEDLSAAIGESQRQGLKVVLALHINSLDGTWRGYIDPPDKESFFANYREFLNRYAEFAQQHKVEGLIVGSELVKLTQPEFTAQWRSLILEVRKRFSGFLTYSAEWGSVTPDHQDDPLAEYSQIGFWADLDYLGLAAYFSLATTGAVRPSLIELRSAWREWRLRKIDPFQARLDKPLLFTEVGYRSTLGAAARPWDGGLEDGIDQSLQADLYEALFQTWTGVSWFRGAYFWYWSTNPDAGGAEDPGYSPQNKLAQDTVRRWFALIPAAPGGNSPAP